MERVIFCVLILTAFFSEAYGQQRWVWGSRRSERQLELHRPFLLRPAALPPAAAPAPAGSISPPAAPFGLVPSASSLVPHGSPPAIGKSSSSSLHGTETQGSGASFELRPRPIEPLVFRPLSIDISKLPLQSSSEVDAFEAAFEPQLSEPSSLSREAVHQDLTRGLPFGRPGHPDPIPGVISSNLFPRDIFSVNIDTPSPVRSSQAFVTPPDISILPLEGSSADGRERFEGQPFAESPVGGLTRFHVHSPTPSSERLLFPQRISSLEAINKRQEELFRGTNAKRETVMPKPTRIFLNSQTAFLEESPFLKKKIPNGKKTVKEELAFSGVQSPRGTIRFPKEIQKFNFVPPSQTFPIDEPMIFGLSSDVSSFALPPPTATSLLSAFQQQQARELANRPTRESRDFVRPNRSISGGKTTDLSKTETLVFKKLLNSKKGTKEPAYVWLWPRQAEARSASSTSPAKHAL